jgi:hypothetical protein
MFKGFKPIENQMKNDKRKEKVQQYIAYGRGRDGSVIIPPFRSRIYPADRCDYVG